MSAEHELTACISMAVTIIAVFGFSRTALFLLRQSFTQCRDEFIDVVVFHKDAAS
jgi:hypothetical protein